MKAASSARTLGYSTETGISTTLNDRSVTNWFIRYRTFDSAQDDKRTIMARVMLLSMGSEINRDQNVFSHILDLQSKEAENEQKCWFAYREWICALGYILRRWGIF